MSLIVALAMAAAAMLYVAYPLFLSEEGTASALTADGPDPRLAELISKREATYRVIRELDFDHSIGNLSETDYREMRERLKRQAIGILKEIDEAEGEPTNMVAVVDREAQVEQGAQKAKPRASDAICPACSESIELADRFCRHCGAVLALACPTCGTPRSEDDRFCTGCGAPLG